MLVEVLREDADETADVGAEVSTSFDVAGRRRLDLPVCLPRVLERLFVDIVLNEKQFVALVYNVKNAEVFEKRVHANHSKIKWSCSMQRTLTHVKLQPAPICDSNKYIRAKLTTISENRAQLARMKHAAGTGG